MSDRLTIQAGAGGRAAVHGPGGPTGRSSHPTPQGVQHHSAPPFQPLRYQFTAVRTSKYAQQYVSLPAALLKHLMKHLTKLTQNLLRHQVLS